MIITEDATLELYCFVNKPNQQQENEKKIRVEDCELYSKKGVHIATHLGNFIIRYQKQKMDVYEELSKLVWCLIRDISRIHLKNEFYASSYSEVHTGADLYAYFSATNEMVKIAYLDSRISSNAYCSIQNERGNSLDYKTFDSTSDWLHSIIEKGLPIYTKEYVKKNKIEYHYFYESLIEIPYRAFFGSFFNKLTHYWCILREAGIIRDDFNDLEKAKENAENIRKKLGMV